MKNSIIFALSIFLIYSQVFAKHGTKNNCFECAKSNFGKNFMCKSQETKKSDPWGVKCCKPNSKELECQPSQENKCSPVFKESKPDFYQHCPLINSTSCGLKNNEAGLVIETPDTFEAKKIFEFNHMRY